MIHKLDECVLRPLEEKDCMRLYKYKNDLEIASLLGGFHPGLSLQDIRNWLDYHRKQKNEILLAIADSKKGICLGHVGIYQIDYRIRSAEFAIMIGSKAHRGKGLGRAITDYIIRWAFAELNLNRLSLSVLATNERAIRLYKSLGFQEEGCLRAAQYKNGRYIDVIVMAILKADLERK